MFLFPHFGRSTIYMGGLSVMFVLLITIGGLGFSNGDTQKTAVAVLFVISTLVNMISVGPVCYPIVAETPSGRLRYKTVVIGRFVYNLTGIFSNSVTPRMVSPIGPSNLCRNRLEYLADYCQQGGTGEQRARSSTREQTCSVIFGVGSVFQKQRIGLSARSTFFSTIKFQPGSSRLLLLLVSSCAQPATVVLC